MRADRTRMCHMRRRIHVSCVQIGQGCGLMAAAVHKTAKMTPTGLGLSFSGARCDHRRASGKGRRNPSWALANFLLGMLRSWEAAQRGGALTPFLSWPVQRGGVDPILGVAHVTRHTIPHTVHIQHTKHKTWRRMLAYGLERLVCWDAPCIHATEGHDAVVNVAPQDLEQFWRVASILSFVYFRSQGSCVCADVYEQGADGKSVRRQGSTERINAPR